MRHLSSSLIRHSHELADRLGINVIRRKLPPGLELYARTADFTPDTLPPELAAGHHIAEDAWGLIRVHEGALLYALDTPNSASVVLTAGDHAVIEPQKLHSLRFLEPGRFFIEFHIAREKLRAAKPHGAC